MNDFVAATFPKGSDLKSHGGNIPVWNNEICRISQNVCFSQQSIYEPGKRHWLKVKKDYLHQGSMADSADLIVLGAYYGTGNKGKCVCVCVCVRSHVCGVQGTYTIL